MRALLRFMLGLVAAVAAWSLAVRLDFRLAPIFDPLLVLVVYHAMRPMDLRLGGGRLSSPLTCALVGSVAGLVHDVLTGGRLGLYGFADTLAAWTVSKVQQRMVLQQTLQIGLAGALASAFQLAVLATLQFLMVSTGELPAVGPAVLRIALTGLLLVFVHATAERVQILDAQWREKRRARLRFDP